jgi:predicted HicB family RNase H-like nuclease
MAQLQVPIDDSLMAKLKLAALKAGKSLRVYVADILKQAVTK